jgi:hypothetical protein
LSDINDGREPLFLVRQAINNANKEEKQKIQKKRKIFLVACQLSKEQFNKILPDKSNDISSIYGRLHRITDVFKQANVYILQRGQLENYFSSYQGSPYLIPNDVKKDLLEKERNEIVSKGKYWVENNSQYKEIIDILDSASSSTSVDLGRPLSYLLQDWIYKVQTVFQRRGIKDVEELKNSSDIEWSAYSQVFEDLDFRLNSMGFTCKLKIRADVDPSQPWCTFTHDTVASQVLLYQNF